MRYEVLRRFGYRKRGGEVTVGDEVFSTVSWEINGGEWEEIPRDELLVVLSALLAENTEWTAGMALDTIEKQAGGVAIQDTKPPNGREKKITMVFRAVNEPDQSKEEVCTATTKN